VLMFLHSGAELMYLKLFTDFYESLNLTASTKLFTLGFVGKMLQTPFCVSYNHLIAFGSCVFSSEKIVEIE